MIKLSLPYPVSANVYWRSRVVKSTRGHTAMTYVSAEATAYKREVAWRARAAGVREPIRGRVRVIIRLYPQRPQDWLKRAQRDPQGWDNGIRCIDLDNARKVLYDALKGVAFEDDKWVFIDHAERMEPDGDARVEVEVLPIVRAAAQAELIAA